MNWDDLRVLLAVARAGSIPAAAKALGVSHSTVYRKVKGFEDEQRLNLFERHADGFRLADDASRFVELAEKVESAVGDLERDLRRYGDDVAGTVSIAAPEAAAITICAQLGPILERFGRLKLNWQLDADASSLIQRECDIAIVAAAAPPPTLVGRRLADIAFAVYGSQSWLDREGIENAKQARWIVFDDSLRDSPVVQWENANVPEASIAMRVNRRVMLDEAVLAGLGVGVMPRLTGDANPSLRCLGAIDVRLPLWVLTHPDLREAASVRTVFDAIGVLLGTERSRIEGSDFEEE